MRIFIIILIAACVTTQEVRHELCRVMCVKDGYTGGVAYKSKCLCYDEKNFEDILHNRINLGPHTPDNKYAPKVFDRWEE